MKCNKVLYATKKEAKIAARKQKKWKGQMRAYFCEHHNAWHLTSMSLNEFQILQNKIKRNEPTKTQQQKDNKR